MNSKPEALYPAIMQALAYSRVDTGAVHSFAGMGLVS